MLTKQAAITYIITMNIQTLSTTMAQGRVQEQAAVKVQSMAIQNMKESGDKLERLMDSTQLLSDPAKGNLLDIRA